MLNRNRLHGVNILHVVRSGKPHDGEGVELPSVKCGRCHSLYCESPLSHCHPKLCGLLQIGIEEDRVILCLCTLSVQLIDGRRDDDILLG